MMPYPYCEIPDSKIDEIKRRFGFWPGYQTSYLRSNIEQAACFYYEHTPPATAKQVGRRLRRIHRLAAALLEQLGENGVEFVDVEPVGIRRPLIALRDAASQYAEKFERAAPEQGQKPRHGTRNFVLHLQFTYLKGTGHTARYTWNPIEGRYRGGLLEFIREVAPVCGIAISDSSIVDMIQALERSGSLYR